MQVLHAKIKIITSQVMLIKLWQRKLLLWPRKARIQASRAQNMEEAVATMAARLETTPFYEGATKEEIMQSAHKFVFGAKSRPDKTKNSKPQQVELTKDPNYEPADGEMANAELEEVVADEEEGYIAENLSNKVRISCIPIHTCGRFAY
jgi:hypothetical protein